MKFPIERYHIIKHQHPTYLTTEIIAKSTYAGNVVKGKAICRIDDTYDEEKGIQLAAARCAVKVAKKRKARANELLAEATKKLAEAQKLVEEMTNFLADATVEFDEAKKDVENILSNMGA